MEGASLKIHYLGCEQSGKPYFQNTVSQTVLQALMKSSSGGSSCCLFTLSVGVVRPLFHCSVSCEHSAVSTYHFHCPKPQSTALFGITQFPWHLHLPLFSLISSSVFELTVPDVPYSMFTYTWEPVSHCTSLIGFSWPNLVLQKFVNDTFVIIIIICILKPVPIRICSGGWASSLFKL